MKNSMLVAVSFMMALQSAAPGGPNSGHSQLTSYRISVQLRGLKCVELAVWGNGFDIPESAGIKRRIERTAGKRLKKAGICLGGEQGAVLCVEVSAFAVDAKAAQDGLIIRVRTRLFEQASLKRAPLLGNPHGYETWDTEWLEFLRKKNIRKFVSREVKEQVEEFCSDWQDARERTLKNDH